MATVLTRMVRGSRSLPISGRVIAPVGEGQMANSSSIEWTKATWNPTVGCTAVSEGCKHCYAKIMHDRLGLMGQAKYGLPFEVVRPWPKQLDTPLTWKKPTTIFVNSMSDLFHKDLPVEYVQEVFRVMEQASWHQFQVLTKRATRIPQLMNSLPWPINVWMGVSVEREQEAWRIPYLREVPAAVRFLSVEPLLGPIPDLDLEGIDWAYIGGESPQPIGTNPIAIQNCTNAGCQFTSTGQAFRPMHPDWARRVRDLLLKHGIPFLFKQWGAPPVNPNPKTDPSFPGDPRGGCQLDGQLYDSCP